MTIYYLKKRKEELLGKHYCSEVTRILHSSTFSLQFTKQEFSILSGLSEFWKSNIKVIEIIHEMLCCGASIDEVRDYFTEVKSIVLFKSCKKRVNTKVRQQNKPDSCLCIIDDW